MLKEELKSKEKAQKQLKFENDRLYIQFKEMNVQTSKPSGEEFEKKYLLEQETWRKKVKRLTGEVDHLQTYLDLIVQFLKKVIPLQE